MLALICCIGVPLWEKEVKVIYFLASDYVDDGSGVMLFTGNFLISLLFPCIDLLAYLNQQRWV